MSSVDVMATSRRLSATNGPVAAFLGATALVIAVCAPAFLPPFYVQFLALVLTYATWALSFGLVMGHLGLTSFGHAALFGGGAYAAALVGLHIAPSLALSLLAGAIFGAFIGAVMGIVLGRLNGVAFAIGSLAFGGMIYQIAHGWVDVTGGSVSIDGTDLRDLRIKDLRGLMGIVTQDSLLFNDTVAANIAFGRTGIGEAGIQRAAEIANAHEFIQRLPNGYNTSIGDAGNRLSGGQKQRIAIARAVLGDPSILILDEATSALDTESEKLVQDALFKLMKARTSLVIAHRLSTIQHCDEIIVLDHGRIIERGTHAGLFAANGQYRKLCDLQAFA